MELLDDDPFNVEPQPNTEQLFSWLACGDPDRGVGETYGISGPIRTLLYPEQVPLLIGWAMQPIDQTTPGSEVPWVTSEPAGQLASMAADFSYRDDDGVERKARYLGGKVTGFTLSADRGTRDGAFVLELQTAWSERTTTTATAPPASEYPSAAPYFLSSTSGNVVVNGNTISNYRSLSIAGNYTAPITFDEDPTITRIRHYRREMTAELGARLRFTPDFRALFEARTTFAASIALDYPGGAGQQTISFSLPRGRMTEWSRTLPLNADRTQSTTILGELDRTTGTNFSVAIGTQA